MRNARAGRLLSAGVRIVLAGSPNTGKSSLLNCLLREQRAIVTDVAGTTRDVLREELDLFGLPVQLSDTAGLRSAEDAVERAGEGLEILLSDAKEHGYERVGVVSHGGTLMGLLWRFGRPERDYYDWMCPNCGGFRMALDPDTLALTVLEEFKGEKGL